MLTLLAELNKLRSVDVMFFVIIGVIIGLCVLIYFLIPVINQKQYQEMRENLKRREIAFNANKQDAETTEEVVADKQPTDNDTQDE